jgi:broad specificity phosphatase PhoE
MDLFLVRHGEPDWTQGGLARNDPRLTDLGHEQAQRVAHRLSSLDHVNEVWASPMHRAQETSVPVAEAVGLERETHQWLQELNNPPEFEGAPGDEVNRFFETVNQRSMEEMWDGFGENAESFRDFHARVTQGLVETLDAHGIHPYSDDRHLWTVDEPTKRVIIVAHGGTNAVILGYLLGLDPVPWEWERFAQPHTGVSRLTLVRIADGWAFSLRQLGDVAHLHPGMVTA